MTADGNPLSAALAPRARRRPSVRPRRGGVPAPARRRVVGVDARPAEHSSSGRSSPTRASRCGGGRAGGAAAGSTASCCRGCAGRPPLLATRVRAACRWSPRWSWRSRSRRAVVASPAATARHDDGADRHCAQAGIPPRCAATRTAALRVATGAGRTFVVELSSFQLEPPTPSPARGARSTSPPTTSTATPTCELRRAKQRIFRRQGTTTCGAQRRRAAVRRCRCRRAGGCFRASAATPCRRRRWWGDAVIEAGSGESSSRRDVPLPGPHHSRTPWPPRYCRSPPRPPDRARRPAQLQGLPHRTEPVGEVAGVPSSTTARAPTSGHRQGARGFADGSVHLVLGGRGKVTVLGDELVGLIRRKVRRAYLIGEEAERFGRELAGIVPYTARTPRGGGARAASAARPGRPCWLSPACASFDQFATTTTRGEVFQQLVRDLATATECQRRG